MTETSPSPHAIRTADLAAKARHFKIVATTSEMGDVAQQLEILAVRKLTFVGKLVPAGKRDWVIEAQLGATVEQACTATLVPVRTRIDADVTRRLIAGFSDPEAPESEMPEDDSIEALGVWIDLQAIMIEALSLELPDYPRADDAKFEDQQFAAQGITPLTNEALRPFAGLAELKDKLENKE